MDGQCASAKFNGLGGVAVDVSGNIIVTDFNNYRVRKISPSGLCRSVSALFVLMLAWVIVWKRHGDDIGRKWN